MPLPSSFFDRPTLVVARDLLGRHLVHERPSGERLVGRIVETEGYTQDDPAFHGWGLVDPHTGLLKPEGRGRDLFTHPGRAYVYLIWGRYWLLNVVTEPEGIGGAVLIRAVEPVEGERMMRERRDVRRPVDVSNGPGKLTIALGIDDRFHGRDLTAPPLYFEAGAPVPDARVATSCRIGLTRGVEHPWRYFVAGHPYVSPGTPSDVVMARKKARKRRR